MPSRTPLSEVATRHQVYLERLKSGEVKKVAPELKRMEKEITGLLAELEPGPLSGMTKKALNDLLREVRERQTQIMLDALGELTASMEEIAGYEAEFEAKALKQAVKDVAIAVPPAAKAYKAALARPLTATGDLLDPFLKDWTAKEVKAVNNLIRKGYADGWTNQRLAQALRGTKALGYKDGLMARIGRDAEAVVRTAVQHVASAARAQTWAENADIVKRYEIVATLDGKTSAKCRAMDGEVFKLGEGPMPPFHLGCRTTTLGRLSSKYDFLDEGATRSSATGYVDADLTYYEWLKQQPTAFQNSAIGPVRAKLLRDGGLTADEFARLNLGRNFEPLTLDEMRALEPTAFEKAGLAGSD